MTISIHQPNFFPYYPFFQKVQQSDLFVILSHCQFEKNNYQNRFHFKDKWFTMCVNKGLEPIENKTYISDKRDWQRIKSELPHYKILSEFDSCISRSLLLCNSAIIHKACRLLKITTPITFDYPTNLKGTARLVDICKHYGANNYLSGISGLKYLEVSLFIEAGIKVIFQDEKTMIKKALIEIL